jgi:hypothetical protein
MGEGVGRSDGSVEGSGPNSDSSKRDLESSTAELIDDWDWNDDVDRLEGVLRSDEGVIENEKPEGASDR